MDEELMPASEPERRERGSREERAREREQEKGREARRAGTYPVGTLARWRARLNEGSIYLGFDELGSTELGSTDCLSLGLS